MPDKFVPPSWDREAYLIPRNYYNDPPIEYPRHPDRQGRGPGYHAEIFRSLRETMMGGIEQKANENRRRRQRLRELGVLNDERRMSVRPLRKDKKKRRSETRAQFIERRSRERGLD